MTTENRLTSGLAGLRTLRTAAVLPQSTNFTIYTVTGQILLMGLVAEVTTVIQSGANNLKVAIDPTGAGLATTDLCVAADIASSVVGSFLSLTGVLADSLQIGPTGVLFDRPLIIPAGALKLYCDASKTGGLKFTCHYLPYEDTARVRAVANP